MRMEEGGAGAAMGVDLMAANRMAGAMVGSSVTADRVHRLLRMGSKLRLRRQPEAPQATRSKRELSKQDFS